MKIFYLILLLLVIPFVIQQADGAALNSTVHIENGTAATSSTSLVTLFSIDESQFTDNHHYLVMSRYDSKNAGTAYWDRHYLRLTSGSPLQGCLNYNESDYSNGWVANQCYNILNMTTNGLDIVGYVENAGTSLTVANWQVTAIDLNELEDGSSSGFVDGIDYIRQFASGTTALTAHPTYAEHDQLDLQPTVNSTDWLLFVNWRHEVNDVGQGIYHGARFDNRWGNLGFEYNEDSTQFQSYSGVYYWEDVDNSTSTPIYTRMSCDVSACSPADYIDQQSTFALKMDNFQDYNFTTRYYGQANVNIDTTNNFATSTEVSSTEITPTQEGDFVIIGGSQSYDINQDGGCAKQRVQVDGTDITETRTTDNYCFRDVSLQWIIYTNGDEHGITNLDTTTHDLALDSTSDSSFPAHSRSAFIGGFSLELAATAPLEVTVSDEFTMDELVSILSSHVITVSDEFTWDDLASLFTSNEITVTDEFAFDPIGAFAGTNVIFVSDNFAMSDEAISDAIQPIYNTIVIRLNSPLLDRLGGVYAVTCPTNSTLTGLLTNGTFVCTPMADFFP